MNQPMELDEAVAGNPGGGASFPRKRNIGVNWI